MLIPDPKFYLKELHSDQPTLISMQVKFDNQRIFISTGQKILKDEWSFEKQRAIVNKRNLQSSSINLWLDKLSSEFKTIFRNALIDGERPNAIAITKLLQEKLNLNYTGSDSRKENLTFFRFIEKFIEESKSQKAIGTIKNYKNTFKHLKDYSKLSGIQFDFNDITIEWRSGFLKYLQSIGMARNSEGKHIKNIKVFLNIATERKLNTKLDFRLRSFSKPVESVRKLFLTIDEIKSINELDLSNEKELDIVRDFFVISTMTALRYSDVINLKAENIKEDRIEIITKKTGESVVIPLSPIVKNIFLKYGNNLPKAPCNQVYNKQIKRVGEKAELNEPITIVRTSGGIKKAITLPKYEFLSSHCGRRSMISNSILAGINTASIQLISGHRNLQSFQSYVQISKQQNADALLNNAFFK